MKLSFLGKRSNEKRTNPSHYLSLQKIVIYDCFSIFLCDFQTLSAADLRDPEITALIAAKMREFHSLAVPGPKNVLIWDTMRY